MNEVTFTEKEFDQLRKFQNKMNAVFGEQAYVGTDYATVLLEYSPFLKAMIRPLVQNPQFKFEVKLLACKVCKRTALFLATPEENEYVCNDCVGKSRKQSS